MAEDWALEEEEEEEERDTRILNLMMPMLRGGKDDFGREEVPPLPLLLDRVSEGLLPRSNAPFFKVPSEVLAEIVQFLDPESLASLALVNRDCQQLARSRQFASVLLDYSDSSLCLIQKLGLEGEDRSKSPHGAASQPTIGACIRRITLATDANWVSHRHNINLLDDSDEEGEDKAKKKGKRMADASHLFFDKYLPLVILLLAWPPILPHLELFDWEDKVVIPRFALETLARSSVRHLKLFRVLIDEEFELPDASTSVGWPLQSLYMEVHWNVFGKNLRGSTAPLCASILRLSAPTLVSLNWETAIDHSVHSFIAGSKEPPKFPHLRELRLGNIKFADSLTLDALLEGNLVSLMADTDQTDIHRHCFQNRGTIRSLETFIWETFHIPANHRLTFLRANSQLSKLSVPYPAPPVLLDTQLLPLLSSNFKNLRSLCLVWEGVEIPDSALNIISTLETLEQIHLSAGEQLGWRHDWLINHESMRSFLRPLPYLRKLAFSRDSYDSGVVGSLVSHYYEEASFDVGTVDFEEGETRHAIWERVHRKRILDEATKYADSLPKLEWLYFGQIPMSVKRIDGLEGKRYAVPLSTERDSCWTLLREMFGGVID
jgi:hypothetical protein